MSWPVRLGTRPRPAAGGPWCSPGEKLALGQLPPPCLQLLPGRLSQRQAEQWPPGQAAAAASSMAGDLASAPTLSRPSGQ